MCGIFQTWLGNVVIVKGMGKWLNVLKYEVQFKILVILDELNFKLNNILFKH